MPKRKVKGKAPDNYVWCKEQWVPVGRCTAGCWRNEKKCAIYKTYMEEQRGKDIPEGKDNKGKRRKGKR